jgi:hypothetical protein
MKTILVLLILGAVLGLVCGVASPAGETELKGNKIPTDSVSIIFTIIWFEILISISVLLYEKNRERRWGWLGVGESIETTETAVWLLWRRMPSTILLSKILEIVPYLPLGTSTKLLLVLGISNKNYILGFQQD